MRLTPPQIKVIPDTLSKVQIGQAYNDIGILFQDIRQVASVVITLQMFCTESANSPHLPALKGLRDT